jgi:hypothetical protein
MPWLNRKNSDEENSHFPACGTYDTDFSVSAFARCSPAAGVAFKI